MNDDPFPSVLTPMLATAASELPIGEGWAFEVKWDGVRAITFVPPDGGPLRIVGRNGTDFTGRYPELGGLRSALDGYGGAVLDGEVVAVDDAGRPSFERLQHRMHVVGAAEVRRRMAEVPVRYAVFDVCWLHGRSLFGCRWTDRRALLDELPLDDGPAWQVPAARLGDGTELQAATKAAGFEGVMAKRTESIYEPGRRSRGWLKVKNVRRQEVVVGGWVGGERGRLGRIGALLIGVYDDEGNLLPCGKVGTGFTDAVLADLQRRLEALAVDHSPFVRRVPEERVAHFARPELVAEVAFTEWTTAGTLRHPSYQGRRDDKEARDVRREEP